MSKSAASEKVVIVPNFVQVRQKPRMSPADYLSKLLRRGLGEDGKEAPDPTPMEPPVGWFKQPSMVEHIRNLVRSEHLRQLAENEGYETLDEADDFEVEDDLHPVSAHEVGDDLEPISSLRNKSKAEEDRAKAEAEKADNAAKARPSKTAEPNTPNDDHQSGSAKAD